MLLLPQTARTDSRRTDDCRRYFCIVWDGIVAVVLGQSRLRNRGDSTQAVFLAQEGIDAARSIRDNGWLNLTNGNHGLQRTGGYWSFLGASEVIDGTYTRVIAVSDVNRDGSGNIVTSGGTVDPRTKLVSATVSWTPGVFVPRAVSVQAYLVDWNVYDWTQTTDADFNAGTHGSTVVSGSGMAANVVLVQTVGGGGGDPEWAVGGGQTYTDTTDTDFSAGTYVNTLVSGTGTSGKVTLTTQSTWTQINPPFSTVDVNAVSSNWAVGDNGDIFYWSGSIWIEASSPTVEGLYGVSEVSPTEAHAIGNNGTFLRYNGTNWVSESSPSPHRMNGISMVNSAFGVVAGDSGDIAHWNGTVWSLVSSPTGKKLNGVDMLSTSDGWIVGEDGVIFRWNDRHGQRFIADGDELLSGQSSASNGTAVAKTADYSWNGVLVNGCFSCQ